MSTVDRTPVALGSGSAGDLHKRPSLAAWLIDDTRIALGRSVCAMARRWLLLAGLAGVGLVGATVAFPRLRAVPEPALLDLVVPLVFFGCSLLLALRSSNAAAGLLGASGMVWCTVGLATSLPASLRDAVLRLGVVPLALVVVAVASLPTGSIRSVRFAVVVSLGFATLGGAGLVVSVRLALGSILLVTALGRTRAAGWAAVVRSRSGLFAVLLQSCVGAALVALDPRVDATFLSPESSSRAVAIAMVGSAVGVARVLDSESLGWGSGRDGSGYDEGLSVESWLGDLLGSPGLRITYPGMSGDWLLENGQPCGQPSGPAFARPDGQVVAWFDRDVDVDRPLRARLHDLLETVGASARLRTAQIERSAELERSRARIAESAYAERVALQGRLERSVVPLLDAIEARTAGLPDSDGVVERIDAVRGQLLAVFRGLAPVGDSGLGEALAHLASLAPDLVSVDLARLEPPPEAPAPDTAEATAIWFATAEAVTNALKYASGSPVSVRAKGPCEVEVIDRGPGGADPDGSGLAGIRDRLAAVGGRVEIVSGPGGSRVSVQVLGRIRAGSYAGRGLATTTPPTGASYGR